MSLPIPQYVANLLVEKGNNLDYERLDSVLYTLMKTKFLNYSDEQIWDYTEKNERDIANELFIKTSESQLDCVDVNFEILEDAANYYIKFFDKPGIALLRKLQAEASSKFEIFCSDLLNKLGGTSSVIGSKQDGGIDFVSFSLRLFGLPKPSTKGSSIIVIGQAKRYKDGNHVTEKEVREFIGASVMKIDELKKTRSDKLGVFQPVVLAFWTTSDFHVNAKDFARKMGIWYLNGAALCQLAIQLGISV